MDIRKFYKSFFSLYFLLVFQNVITLSVNLADNIMLGAYSEASLSGVTAVNQIQFIFQQMLGAVGEGIVMLGSQYWGQKNPAAVKKVSAIAMRFALGIAVLLFTVVSLFPYQVLGLFTNEQAIVSEGVSYLRIIRFTYLFFAMTMILLATMRTVQVAKIAFWLSVSTLIINCCINYVLIYGRFGAPRMGAAGAAVGTLVARIVELGIVLWFVLKKDTRLHIRIADYLRIDMLLLKDYVRITIPMFVVSSLWGFNTALQTLILGRMTARAIAANSVASNLFLMVKSMAVGASATASVLIGKAVGEGDVAIVKAYAKRLQVMFACIGLFSGVLLFFLRVPVLSLYDISEETRQMANTFLLILCVVCATMSYQMPTNTGIIRGGGDSAYVVKLDLISIWGIVIPLSFIMAFIVQAPPAVVVICLNLDQMFKCIPAFIKANYGNWIKKLTR